MGSPPALCHDSQVCRPEIVPVFRTALFSAMQRGGERVENVFCLPQEEGYIITIMVDFYEGDLPGVYRG